MNKVRKTLTTLLVILASHAFSQTQENPTFVNTTEVIADVGKIAAEDKTPEIGANLVNSATSKPNFIFYLSDDQDKLDYGCYGNPNVHTPEVDELATEGLKFNNAFVGQAICAPSRSQLYTGLYPLKNGTFVNHVQSKDNLISVAQLLGDAGYEVVLAGKSHVSPSSVYAWDFEWEDEPYAGFEMHDAIPISQIDNYMRSATKPFCIFIASHYPHGPYPAEPETPVEDVMVHPYFGKLGRTAESLRGLYDNIRKDNEMLGWVVDLVDDIPSLSNTIFVYSSDHGNSGKYTLTDAGLNVPFVVRWPGVVTPNTTTDAMIHYTDVLPTFLDLAGADIPAYIDGKSFADVLTGAADKHQEYVYGVANHQNQLIPYIYPSRLIRGEDFAYMRNFNSIENYESNYGDDANINLFIERAALKFKAPAEELYDMVNDPYQLNNLANDPAYASVKADLGKKLELWMIQQDDYLLEHKMPLIYAKNNPLDVKTSYNNIKDDLVGILEHSEHLFETKSLDFELNRATQVLIDSITISDSTLLLNEGGSGSLSSVIYPANADEQSKLWWSSNDDVVTVDQAGNVNGIGAGAAEISIVTFDGLHEKTCAVKVIPEGADPEDCVIDSDGDGLEDCFDQCPEDPNKTEPGTCGCGTADADENGDGILDCAKTAADNPGFEDGIFTGWSFSSTQGAVGVAEAENTYAGNISVKITNTAADKGWKTLYNHTTPFSEFEAGEQVTLVLFAKALNATGTPTFKINFRYKLTTSDAYIFANSSAFQLSETYQKYEYVFTVPADFNFLELRLYFGETIADFYIDDLLFVKTKDCNGALYGEAYVDECGTCVGGNTGKVSDSDGDGVLDCDEAAAAIIETSSSLSELIIYPNPVKNELVIRGIERFDSYKIYNLTGKVVMQGLVSGQKSISVERLMNGYYILTTIQDNLINKIAFVKQ